MAWMDNIKTWTGLSVEESVRMTEDRDKWRKYVHGVANLRIEGRLKNRTEPTTSFGSWDAAVAHTPVLFIIVRSKPTGAGRPTSIYSRSPNSQRCASSDNRAGS